MYRIKRRFSWGLTEVLVKLPDMSVEFNDIALDWYYELQQYTNERWVNMPDSKWYNEEDAYEIMKHLICKESETPVTEYQYNKN